MFLGARESPISSGFSFKVNTANSDGGDATLDKSSVELSPT